MIGTQAAAAIIECDDSYIRMLIYDGRLTAQKVGKTWVLDQADVERFKRERDHARQCLAGVPL